MKSHYARSYPESKQLREQLWLQNTERLEIRALHVGLGLEGSKKQVVHREEAKKVSLDQTSLPQLSEDMLGDFSQVTISPTEDNLSNLIASMRSSKPVLSKIVSEEKIQTVGITLPELPRDRFNYGESILANLNVFKKILLLHLADFILVMSIFSMCFMLAVIGYKISQPNELAQDFTKWEPIKFLLERSWYEMILAFYGIFFVYWLTFKALRINTFGKFLVNDIKQSQKLPSTF